MKKKINRKKAVKIIKKKSKPQVSSWYALNPEFEFFGELRSLILKSSPAEKDKMIKKISGLGKIKMAVISGVFLNNKDSMDTIDSDIDLFIVGDDVSKPRLNTFLRALEAEVGKEIRFGIMEKEEFEYRYGMFDRFVRVLLEGPHVKLINKLGL